MGAQAIIDRFLQLIDSPSSYSGEAGKAVLVKGAEDGLEFGAAIGAMELIEEVVLTGSVTSVAFSSIPGTYRTLFMLLSIRTDVAAENDSVVWRVNGDAGDNYDWAQHLHWPPAGIETTGDRQASFGVAGLCEGGNSRASCFGMSQIQWPYYATTDREKIGLCDISERIGDLSTDSDLRINQAFAHWRNTAVITSIAILPFAGSNLVSGSRLALYGVT